MLTSREGKTSRSAHGEYLVQASPLAVTLDIIRPAAQDCTHFPMVVNVCQEALTLELEIF